MFLYMVHDKVWRKNCFHEYKTLGNPGTNPVCSMKSRLIKLVSQETWFFTFGHDDKREVHFLLSSSYALLRWNQKLLV